MLDEVAAAKKAGVGKEEFGKVFDLQRKAQWRLDFVNAENSMGFHADQETARVLGESIDFFRLAQLEAQQLRLSRGTAPTTLPTAMR
jgi:nitrite reductase (cytochrome c-552)